MDREGSDVEVYFVNPIDVLLCRVKLGYFVHPGGWGFNLPFIGFTIDRR